MSGYGARSHKLGSIYSRYRSMIRSGVIKHKERPIWYDIYQRFPPVAEPVYKPDTEVDHHTGLVHSEDKVPKIFYQEDWARMQFHRHYPKPTKEMLPMANTTKAYRSTLQIFIKSFRKISQDNKNMSNEEIFIKTEEELKKLNPYLLSNSVNK